MRPQICRFVLTALLITIPATAIAEVTLPRIFGSNMVLQRDQSVHVWGWADPSEAITVNLDGVTVTTKADDKGNRRVQLPARKAAGKSSTLIVSGSNKIELKNLLMGEVWLGSGQSKRHQLASR